MRFNDLSKYDVAIWVEKRFDEDLKLSFSRCRFKYQCSGKKIHITDLEAGGKYIDRTVTISNLYFILYH